MTRRRKGEKAVVHPLTVWSETCTIARMIRSGDWWFYAWFVQTSKRGLEKLVKQTEIPEARLNALWRGDEPTEGELDLLAGPFRTDAASLRASVEYAKALKGERRHAS
jgi:hypothetical protein